MKRNESLRFYLFSVFIFTICNWALAKTPVTFYSQPYSLALKNLNYSHLQISTRRILPLMGNWDILQTGNSHKAGQINIPSVFHEKHPFIFRKKFERQKGLPDSYILHFKGINGFTQIRINQRLYFQGNNNFLPLQFSVNPDLLDDSTNVLEVLISPGEKAETRLPPWFPVNLPRIVNGLWGNVYLEILPPAFIGETGVGLRMNAENWLLGLRTRLKVPHQLQNNLFMRAQLVKNKKILWQDRIDIPEVSPENKFQFQLPTFAPWSPNQPNCYQLRLGLFRGDSLLDEYQTNLSACEIATNGNNLRLNNQPLTVKGINYIYQNAKGVSLPSKELFLKDLTRIKSMGFNSIRVGFYPQSSLFYSLTDSLGLLVFQDLPFPFVYRDFLTDSLRRDRVKNYLKKFLSIAWQHPSIIAIGFPDYSDGKFGVEIAKIFDIFAPGAFLIYQDSPFRLFHNKNEYSLKIQEIVKRNHPGIFLSELQKTIPENFPLFFSGLSKAISYRIDSTAFTHDLRQLAALNFRLHQNFWQRRLAGTFIFTYSDYFLETPALQAGSKVNFQLNTSGIFDLKRQLKKEIGSINRLTHGNQFGQEIQPEKKDFGTFLFIIIGLANLLLFMLLYQSQVEFRQDVHRSIRRPHGFFTDIFERRLIRYSNSFFLLFIMAVNGAVIIGSILYFFRNNLFMDYLLSLLFPTKELKLIVSNVLWKPALLIPALSALIIIFFLLLTFSLKIISLFREPHIRLHQAIATNTWSASHFIILLPFGMFFYSFLSISKSYWILFLVLLYFNLWYFRRWLLGTRVMTELRYSRVFLFSIGTLGLIGVCIFYYLQSQINVIQHLQFLVNLFYDVN